MSAGEILKALDVVQSTLSHHMKSLVDAGAVSAARHGKWTYYSLNAAILADAVRFLGEFSEGTRMPAQFEKEETGSAPERSSPAGITDILQEDMPRRAKQESEDSSRKMPKEKDSGESSGSHGEKKKSKKGKKGKKGKK